MKTAEYIWSVLFPVSMPESCISIVGACTFSVNLPACKVSPHRPVADPKICPPRGGPLYISFNRGKVWAGLCPLDPLLSALVSNHVK